MATAHPPSPPPPSMRLAEILSDLVSLRVCDPAAALALVSARPGPSHDAPAQPNTDISDDGELERAKELLRLHCEVKEAHKRGELRRGLEEARGAVERALGGE